MCGCLCGLDSECGLDSVCGLDSECGLDGQAYLYQVQGLRPSGREPRRRGPWLPKTFRAWPVVVSAHRLRWASALRFPMVVVMELTLAKTTVRFLSAVYRRP